MEESYSKGINEHQNQPREFSTKEKRTEQSDEAKMNNREEC